MLEKYFSKADKFGTKQIRFKSLRKQIIVFFAVFLIIVQVIGFIGVQYSIEQSAKSNLRRELVVGGRVINRLLEQEGRDMMEATRIALADYAFREAMVRGDKDTILSAFENHGARVNASGMLKVSLDGQVQDNTFDTTLDGQLFAYADLLSIAEKEGKATGLRLMDGKLYRVVVLPLLTPIRIAWIVAAFALDANDTHALQRVSLLDVSFVSQSDTHAPAFIASTLPTIVQEALSPSLSLVAKKPGISHTLELNEESYEVFATPIEAYADVTIFAVLQRSQVEGALPFKSLQIALVFLFTFSLLVTIVGGNFIARRITQPLSLLAGSARKIASGDYSQHVDIYQNDEIGELTNAFNNLASGLAERDRVQDLLGKVTSPAIASELLRQQLDLGGEERIVSVMFIDIRNFTSICEDLTPHQSLDLLNRYLKVMSEVIEQFDGVVDKYTGDGLMALFGAPIAREGDHLRAIQAALQIVRELKALSQQLQGESLPSPDVGIGLNTARVIAGNIGSASRLNYTVLGDGVNLAARFEGLTKRYQVPVVVGQETYATVPEMVYRELDKVRVKGKSIPVHIYQPLGLRSQLSAQDLQLLDQYHRAIQLFRNRDWEKARAVFDQVKQHPDYNRICELYIEYIRQFTAQAPAVDWDGAFTLYEK